MNLETMKEAYGMLYEIETSLICILETTMSHEHGPLWRRKLGEEGKHHLHNTITLSLKYNCLNSYFTPKELCQMYKLISIRNKICHMQDVNNDELSFLSKYYSYIKRNQNYFTIFST